MPIDNEGGRIEEAFIDPPSSQFFELLVLKQLTEIKVEYSIFPRKNKNLHENINEWNHKKTKIVMQIFLKDETNQKVERI